MASDLGVSIVVSASVGGALTGLLSIGKAMKTLDATTSSLKERQQQLRTTLERNHDRLSVQSAKQLWQEYDKIDHSIKKLTASSAKLQHTQALRATNSAQFQQLKGQWQTAAGAAGAVVVPVKLAMDFESSMADVKKVVDFDTPQQFKAMEQDILRMTRSIPMAGTGLAQIAASGGQLGVARQDLTQFTETIAKMGVAFDMPAEQAGDSMAKLANVYKIPIAEISKLGDAINQLSNSSPAKASDIVNTLSRVGGVAKQFGLTELQTASLSNAFISLGKTPEVAGTAINGMLTQLMTADKQGKKFQEALKSMGMDSKTLKKNISENGEKALLDFLKAVQKLPKDQQMGAMVDMFGKEYADDVAVMVGGLDSYKKSIEELQKVGQDGAPAFMGSMEREFAARSATTANQIQLLKNGLSELGINIGSVLLPAVNDFVGYAIKMSHFLSDLTNRYPRLSAAIVKTVMSVAALVAGGWLAVVAVNRLKAAVLLGKAALQSFQTTASVLSLVMKGGIVPADVPGRLGMMVRSLAVARTAMLGFAASSAVAMWPLLLVIGVVAVAALLIYKYWNPIKGFFIGLWDGIKQGFAPLAPLFDSISQFLGRMWQTIQPFVQPILDWFGEFFSVSQVAEGGARSFGQSVGLWIGEKITAVVGWVTGKINELKTAFSGGLTGILGLILNWSPLGAFYSAFAAVMSWFGVTLPASFTGFGRMLLDGLINGIKSRVQAVIGTIASVAARIKSAFTTPVKIESPSKVFKQYGGFIMQGLQLGLDNHAAQPIGALASFASSLGQRFKQHTAPLSVDMATRLTRNADEFAAARAEQTTVQTGGGMTVHYSPNIQVGSGDSAAIKQVLQLDKYELEAMLRRLMDDKLRRAY